MVTSVKVVLSFLLFFLSSSPLSYRQPFSVCYGENMWQYAFLSHITRLSFLNVYINTFWRLLWDIFRETLFLFPCSVSVLWWDCPTVYSSWCTLGSLQLSASPNSHCHRVNLISTCCKVVTVLLCIVVFSCLLQNFLPKLFVCCCKFFMTTVKAFPGWLLVL